MAFLSHNYSPFRVTRNCLFGSGRQSLFFEGSPPSLFQHNVIIQWTYVRQGWTGEWVGRFIAVDCQQATIGFDYFGVIAGIAIRLTPTPTLIPNLYTYRSTKSESGSVRTGLNAAPLRGAARIETKRMSCRDWQSHYNKTKQLLIRMSLLKPNSKSYLGVIPAKAAAHRTSHF